MYNHIMKRRAISYNIACYLMLIMMILGLTTSFILGYNGMNSRYLGPFIFNSSAFLIQAAILLVLVASAYVVADKMYMFALIIVFTNFLTKYLMPYYLFDGYVNYDTPIHYLSALYFRDSGLHPEYHYHTWPSSLILAILYNSVSGLNFPLDYSIIALVSRFLIPLSIYFAAKRFLVSKKAIIIALLVLLIFEPFIIHPCPQITAVALTTLALIFFAIWLHEREHRMSYPLVILGVSIATYHGVMPIGLTLSIIAVLVFYMLTAKLRLAKVYEPLNNKNPSIYFAILIFIIILTFYNTYITIFVTKSLIKTIMLVIQGGQARLDVYPLIIENPHLKWQHDLLYGISRVATIILLGIPSITVSLSLLIKFLKTKLANHEEAILTMAIIAGFNEMLNILLSTILNVGLVERLYQISLILAPLLTAYFYEEYLAKSPPYQKAIYMKKAALTFMLASTFLFVLLSIFTSPAYTSLYINAFGKPDTTSAQWIATHLPSYQIRLDGGGRLNQLVALYSYPSHTYEVNLKITRTIEENALKGTYLYPSGTIITTQSPLTLGTSRVKGLSDVILNNYINEMPVYINKVFSNYICEVFIPG
jgi:hypothetical protein